MRIPISHSTESLERMFQHITDAPIPQRVTIQYLKLEGFVTGHDPELRLILRLLGFLSDDDTPTTKWKRYKQEGRQVLQVAVERVYRDLFAIYPDAISGRSAEDLAKWFAQFNVNGSKTSTERAIRTFRKLCSLAGIKPEDQPPAMPQAEAVQVRQGQVSPAALTGELPSIYLPITTSREVYTALFEAYFDVLGKNRRGD
ncbi:MAG: DUF5343 domain-containing protein [Candidatus Saccharibacteria bacterium]